MKTTRQIQCARVAFYPRRRSRASRPTLACSSTRSTLSKVDNNCEGGIWGCVKALYVSPKIKDARVLQAVGQAGGTVLCDWGRLWGNLGDDGDKDEISLAYLRHWMCLI